MGCGFGYFALNLLQAPELAEFYALDVHCNGLRTVKERARSRGRSLSVVRASIYRTPFADGAFHLITGNGMLHHLEDRHALASEIERILRPGGSAVFVDRYRRVGMDGSTQSLSRLILETHTSIRVRIVFDAASYRAPSRGGCGMVSCLYRMGPSRHR